ncbi:MAG: hypothetical protein JXB32_16650 [Deltaproteobacteria bacterium]|nr:hypothetical protein [Deltaproteobacteria bacterium]
MTALAVWTLGTGGPAGCGAAVVDVDAGPDGEDDGPAGRDDAAVDDRGTHDEATDGAAGEDSDCGTVWFRDDDGDGFGDPDVSTCSPTAPAGYVANDDDCCDANGDVHPQTGAPRYFVLSYECGAGPSFDYDCTRTVEQESPSVTPAPDCTLGTPCGFNHAGWEGGTAPECGGAGRWVQGCVALTCLEDVVTRTQACR